MLANLVHPLRTETLAREMAKAYSSQGEYPGKVADVATVGG